MTNNSLHKIDENATSFTSEKTGYTYRVVQNLTELSFERLRHINKYLTYFMYGITWEDFFEKHEKLQDLIDSEDSKDRKFASTYLYNIRQSMLDFDTKFDPAMQICSLCIFRNDEPMSGLWDQNIASQKIEDWSLNFENGFFLHFATMCAISYPNLKNPTFLESLIKGKSTKEAALIAQRMLSLYTPEP